MNNNLRYEPPAVVHLKHKNDLPMQLVDVRSAAEFADGHAVGAISIPLDELNIQTLKSRWGATELETLSLYLLCQSGVRAEQAANRLQQQGLDKLVVVEGGTSAWQSEGLPMKRTSNLPSLERQTQIAIGGLLMLILIKGLVLHPVFFGLIGIMAVGLIIAGVTEKCTLTGLIARLPWNQVNHGSTA